MNKTGYQYAREVMASLDLYRDCYASAEPYQKHLKEVTQMLRAVANDHRDKKFLLMFADTLEFSNLSVEYVPLAQR